jgi:hypothetical protein
MGKLGLLIWIGVFFAWIIHLRMQKEALELAKRQAERQNLQQTRDS